MPLILQDNRHSRTIVGYEVSRDGTVNLLVFDPALSVSPLPLPCIGSLKSSSAPGRPLRNLALSSTTCSSHSPSPMSADMSTHADHDPNLMLHDSHKRSSGTQSLSDGDTNNAKRFRRFLYLSGQDDGAGRDISGKAIKSRGSRQHFTQFRLSPKMLRFVLCDVPIPTADLSGRKQKYQILYFPMSAPLTDQEKIQRKVVTSRKIC
jgi:hypothetical protein